MTNAANKAKRVIQLVPAIPTSDGAGVAITRAIGHSRLSIVDPFLLLDEIRSDNADDYIAGFPPHPHRGFDTVTYMVDGKMRHKDSNGNEGVIHSGGVQWMRAARGIIHSEIPEQEDGPLWGYQLWVNLPSAHKMDPTDYRDIEKEAIPTLTTETGAVIKVISGKYANACGPLINEHVNLTFFDVSLPDATSFEHAISSQRQVLIYVTHGEARIGTQLVQAKTTAVLGDGDLIRIETNDSDTRLLLIAGTPLKEPVARYGPFVMNTEKQLSQAVKDYQTGQLTD